MNERQNREYQTVVLAALLHIVRSRIVGDVGRDRLNVWAEGRRLIGRRPANGELGNT